MQKRDVAIVLLSCVAILVSLQNEGSFSYRKAWYHTPEPELENVVAEHHQLPPPLVADMNGDGKLEVVTVTADLRLQLVEPRGHGRQGEGFAAAKVIKETSLLNKQVVVMAGRRPVAMHVGYIDPAPVEHIRPPRKQVVVILTASWQVMCYNHNLKLLWERDVRMNFPHHAHIKEVAVFISPHQVKQGDRGLIVVGASVERGDLTSGEGLESSSSKVSDLGMAFGDDDILREQLRMELEEEQHAESLGKDDKLQDLDTRDPLKGLDTSRHFSYFAAEAGSGDQRWHHTSTDFHKDVEEEARELIPQHDFRLDAEKLEGRHFGEASCRDYRNSILHVLPHSWSQPHDTRLEEAHFIKHKVGKGAQKELLGVKKSAKEHPHRSSSLHKPHHGGQHLAGNGMLGSLIGGTLIHHTPGHDRGHAQGGSGGAHHSSRTGTHMQAAHAQNGGRHLKEKQGGQQHGKHTSHWSHHHGNFTANTLVAYLEGGIEVVHLFTGRTVCKLHLPPGELHADINGDGVVDHVQVYRGAGVSGELNSDDNAHRPKSHCVAVATSGIPGSRKLFEVNICKTNKFLSKLGTNILSQEVEDHGAVEFATPIMLPIPEMTHGYSSLHHRHGLIVFSTNKGEVTAVNARGEALWQVYLPTTWPHTMFAESASAKVAPTLAPMALHRHGMPSTILVAGSTHAVILSEHGTLLETLSLPHPPSQSLLVVDFNGDGLNDIVAVTPMGIFGYAQVQHMGGFTLSSLLVTLIIAMGVIYYTQQMAGNGNSTSSSRSGTGAGPAMGYSSDVIMGDRRGVGSRKLRSTDYTD